MEFGCWVTAPPGLQLAVAFAQNALTMGRMGLMCWMQVQQPSGIKGPANTCLVQAAATQMCHERRPWVPNTKACLVMADERDLNLRGRVQNDVWCHLGQ